MTPKRSPASPSEPSPTPLFDFAADSPESTPPSAPTQAPKRGRRPKATQETEPTSAPKSSRTAKKTSPRPTKKPAADATPQELPPNERPFAVPKNWLWTRLGNVARWGSGGTPSRKTPQYYDGSIPWIKSGELNDDYVFDSEEKITEEAIKKSSAKLYPPNTVVIAMYGATIGKTAILGVQATTNQACACAVCRDFLDYRFLFNYARSQKDAFIKKGKGGAQPNISQEVIKPYPFPLPPLAEQERIVALVERLFARLDEAAEIVRETLEQIDLAKKSLLAQAFRGTLVERLADEGTGADWLRQIQNEKAILAKAGKLKKEKTLPPISDEEKLFEIPEHWTWTRLGKIIVLLSGTDFKPEEYNEEQKGTPYITGASSLAADGVIVSRWTEFPKVIANRGDILLVCKGSGYGKTVFCDVDTAHIARQIMAIKYSPNICMQYLRFFLLASFSLIKAKGRGIIPGIDRENILNLPFPLPPLAEQERIVALIERQTRKYDEARELAEETAARIETLKKAILARAFRGELGTNDPTDPKPFATAPTT